MKLLVAFFTLFLFSNLGHTQETKPPKLVVGIVVDQMCYDYLYRFNSKYGTGGFLRLMNEGTNCRTTLYNYVPTYTGPGHASIYTGTTPESHGIVANDWFEKSTGREVNCVQDDNVQTIGAISEEGKCAPTRLKALTITDQLRMTYPSSKVISMSIKNRGAILPGGHLSNGSYWFDYTSGDYITSSYYSNSLPSWVSDFNALDYPQKALKQTWNTLLPIAEYVESFEDNSPYEVVLPGKKTPTFPYDYKKMSGETPNFELFTCSPFANTFLTDFAIEALKNEQLGKSKTTDFLCVSYSTPDIIGHAFGPNSIEIEDTYLRLDKDLERLFNELDEKIGKNEYVVFLTADHAVVPVPQYFIDHKLPGGYVYLDQPISDLKIKLKAKFGDELILEQTNLNIYLNDARISALNLNKEEVMNFIKSDVMKWKNVKRAYTSTELLENGAQDIWTSKVSKGFHSTESGDVVFILEPGFLPKHVESTSGGKGTSHGSAYSYDSHVPLLWMGKNIPRQELFREIQITDITPTLAHLLNLSMPSAVTGSPIIEILQK